MDPALTSLERIRWSIATAIQSLKQGVDASTNREVRALYAKRITPVQHALHAVDQDIAALLRNCTEPAPAPAPRNNTTPPRVADPDTGTGTGTGTQSVQCSGCKGAVRVRPGHTKSTNRPVMRGTCRRCGTRAQRAIPSPPAGR